ncbi:MAG: GntR family transcriptional regulator [Halanaerobiales bacterium]|nr:GntR family transcriptional regulator [Halanaerobiales bacterium]
MTNSLSDKAYIIIKEKILNNTRDKYINLRKMAEELDMSYTPVREAFQRLEREGFLELIPKVGYFIPELDLKDIRDIFETRECIENYVFNKVIDKIEEEHIKELESYLDKMIKNLENNEIKEFYKNDKEFHKVFFKINKNYYLTNLMENVREKHLIGSRKTIMEMKEKGVVPAIEEHKKLVENIKKGNKGAAQKVFAEHIRNSKERMEDGYYLFS